MNQAATADPGDPVQKDADAEIERIFRSYLRKRGFDGTDLIRMSGSDLERLRTDAIANRQHYPVPTTDPAFLYHGTSRGRLKCIVIQGLLPSDRDTWGREIGLADWSLDKVFVIDTVGRAEFYARQKAKRSPVIIRVRRTAIKDIEDDIKEQPGSYFVRRAIPVEDVEFWSGREWKACRPKPTLAAERPADAASASGPR
jgi:hypothetical protein